MKNLSRITAIVLVLCMLVGLTGCADRSWVAKFSLDGECGISSEELAAIISASDISATDVSSETEVISAGFYPACIVHVHDALANEGVISTYTSLDSQTVDGMNALDYIDMKAQLMVKTYVIARRQCELLGLEYDRTASSYYESYLTSYETYKDFYEENGIGLESFMRASLDYDSLLNLLFIAKYEAGGYEAIGDDELMVYYNEGFMRATVIQQSFYNADGTAFTDEEKASAIALFTGYYDQFKAGTANIDDYVAMYSGDSSDYTFGQSNTLATIDENDSTAQAIVAANVGDYVLFQEESYIAIYRKEEVNYDNGVEFKEYRSTLLNYYKYDQFVESLEAIAESADDYKVNNGVFNQLSISKLPMSQTAA